jgi:hypothetical protein
MNKNIFLGVISVIVFILAFTVIYLVVDKNTQAAATISPPNTISVVDSAAVTLGITKDSLEEMISVNDPFSDTDSNGMILSTSTNKPFSNLVATMDYTVSAPTTTTIDGDFNSTIMGNTSITSEETMSIVHRMRYDADSVLVWSEALGDNFSWKQDPSRESIPFGSMVTVTYTTKDASGTWVGDIQIDRPKG